jgi:hypothetical protein
MRMVKQHHTSNFTPLERSGLTMKVKKIRTASSAWLQPLLLCLLMMIQSAYTFSPHHRPQSFSFSPCTTLGATKATKRAWDVTDDWTQRSRADAAGNDPPLSADFMAQDLIQLQILQMQNYGMDVVEEEELSQDEQWIHDAIDEIMSNDDDGTGIDLARDETADTTASSIIDEELMAREIAMLVRCNQDPHGFLLSQGRAVPELTAEERDSVQQLLTLDGEPTTFLREAVKSIFAQHVDGGATVLDSKGIAAWMTTSLGSTPTARVGQHDKRVSQALARYGGDGTMTQDDLLSLYLDAIVGGTQQDGEGRCFATYKDLQEVRAPELSAVWRDIRNHGIVSPAEFERSMRVAELEAKFGKAAEISDYTILDECEILDDVVSSTTDRLGRSSHKRVELVPTGSHHKEVPVWVKDGDFGKGFLFALSVWFFSALLLRS